MISVITKVKVFLDTSALFSAVISEKGGSRQILKLGEAKVISLWIGPWVLQELENVIARKSPQSKTYFALLLDRSNVQICKKAQGEALRQANEVIDYRPDAQIAAEALSIEANYFVSFDRKHLMGNPKTKELPFPIGTAGDFLEWFKNQMAHR